MQLPQQKNNYSICSMFLDGANSIWNALLFRLTKNQWTFSLICCGLHVFFAVAGYYYVEESPSYYYSRKELGKLRQSFQRIS